MSPFIGISCPVCWRMTVRRNLNALTTVLGLARAISALMRPCHSLSWMLSTGRCMTVWKRCFWMARYPRMVDGDNVRLLRLIYSSMETVSVGSCSGSSGFSGSRFLANHSALMAAASLVQSLAVAAVTGMLSPPRRSWINQFPDGSFRGFGVFKCIPPHHKTFVWFLFNRKAARRGGFSVNPGECGNKRKNPFHFRELFQLS